jgi:uncharacterized membrane protein YfcA
MLAIFFFFVFNIKKATAHTKVMNFTSNIVSLVVFVISGEVLFIVGILMGIGQMLGAYLGSNMVVKKDIKFIKVMFLFVVSLSVIKLLYENYI